jgi:hypothetical protein
MSCKKPDNVDCNVEVLEVFFSALKFYRVVERLRPVSDKAVVDISGVA